MSGIYIEREAALSAQNKSMNLSECRKRLERIPAADVRPDKPKWIPVTERLPEDDIVCILTNGISDAIGYRGKVFGWHLIWTDYVVESEVTHWMPLPEPPKEEI